MTGRVDPEVWGPNWLETICPGGPNLMEIVCLEGTILWGSFVQGDWKSTDQMGLGPNVLQPFLLPGN